ncbi:prolyl oligopeptidase family serine peptidase [Arenimonas sp. MALMAid1274]|uniref:prolyl oligopeptidase family serine peptidase n=1 Tax=Arenimonas sp. MALMAid1274 TaxID=3411630 RepID=UPI003BA06089
MPWIRWLCLCCLLLACAQTLARDFKVKPGDVPELRDGEGLVLVAVDSDLAVSSLTVKSESSHFTGGRLEEIGVGQTLGLYVMPAGKYRWDRLRLAWVQWTLRDDPAFRFEVKPGIISYAGDLIFRRASRFHVANRGLRAMDWLEANHPQIAARHEFSYVGLYPDPFPAFYREQFKAGGSPAPDRRNAQRAPPAPGKLPLPVEELWKPSRLGGFAMSPGGRYVAGAIREPGEIWAIDVYDLEGGTIRRIANSRTAVTDLDWKGDDTLLAEITVGAGDPMLWVFRFQDGKDTPDILRVRRPGALVDKLSADPGHILYASRGTRGEAQLHRLDIRTEQALESFRYPLVERLNEGLSGDSYWFTDARGQVRAAIVARDGKAVLVHGADGKFQDVLVLDKDDGFNPMAVSGDGRLIYGLIGADREQRELVEFDPVQRKVTRTLFAKPGIDLVSPIINARGEAIGAAYYESGQLISEYFDAEAQQLRSRLTRSFPGKTVAMLARSEDARQNLLWVDASDQPAVVYHLDLEAGRASVLDESAPWLSGKALAPAVTLQVKSSDGLPIEAYLTLPPGAGRRPLVVMPHGGPIGVADRRHFNPEVQFIASLGYAVLQVNFRGSEGYGKAFREAGYGSLGTLIENDIDAAIEAAVAAHPVDAGRMCMVGASYGGYSGLLSSLRWPGRFRCVVSMFGVSDRGLLFTASDAGRFESLRKELEKMLGNPNTQPELMRETSPLFQYRKLTVPLMLVHGGEDIRVDYEHTRRLVRMLGLDARPPVTLYFKEEGHGISDADNRRKTWEGVAGFLRQHLDAAAAPAAAP